jgi:lipopolysaccharide export system protein LptA
MKSRRTLLVLAALAFARFSGIQAVAQFPGGDPNTPRAPLQIESRTEVQRIGHLAVAKGDVILSFGDTTIYCDYAQYDQQTRDVMVSGDVRIFRGGKIFAGDRAIYNLDSKKLNGSDFRASSGPLMAHAHGFAAVGKDTFEIAGATLTADDSPDPGFHIKSRKVRFFYNDHTEYEDVTVYVGKTPVFWVPYLYQPAKFDQSFSISPGSRSTWGPFLLTRTLFPIGTDTVGAARVDYMAKRGLAIGLDADRKPQNSESWSRLRSYYLNDSNPTPRVQYSADGLTQTESKPISSTRYRVSLQDRTFLTDTVYTSINFNKLSDINYLEDFSPQELRIDPNPDTVLNVTKWDEDYTLSLQFRKQLNSEFEGSGKTPELALDLKRRPLSHTGLFYEGESSVAQLTRKYHVDPYNPLGYDYLTFSTLRADTFHQLTYPKTIGGVLTLVPRFGVRATHYGSTAQNPLINGQPSDDGGSGVNRIVTNLGLEASVKFSKNFDSVESRRWGLDGLKHIVQPFANLSVVSSNQDSSKILPIDSLNPATTLPPIDFPQFNAIDSITDWKILRLGMRHRLLTRRDDATFSWMELDTFFDSRIEEPLIPSFGSLDPGSFSNLFNRLRWSPVPWMNVNLSSQLPVFDEGFSEVNIDSTFQPTRDFTFSVGNRHISGISVGASASAASGDSAANRIAATGLQFQSSDLLYGSARVRINDDWAFTVQENFEARTGQALYQRYSIDRSLRSWIASLNFLVFERNSRNDVSILFTLTLKDLPKIRLPLTFDPSAAASSNNVKNQ